MNTRKIALIALLAPAFVGGIASTACSDASALPGLDNIAEQCGLKCDAQGVVEGNANISGIRSIDAFFGAVVDFNGQATLVSGNIEAQLARIRGTLGVATNADIKAKLTANFAANVMGKATVAVEPPKCQVSASATIEASAKCDATVTPGMASVKCSGTCTAEASASATCDAMATLKCSGSAPMLKCEGTCKAACEGTCMLTGTTKCQGECMGTLGADGNCNGECKLDAGAQCNGSCSAGCKGTCEYTPPMGVMCSGGAEVKCEAKANASVECKGKCEGSFEEPMVKAECKPARVFFKYAVAGGVDAAAKANFDAQMAIVVDAYGQMLAEVKRADVVIKAGANLSTAASGAVTGAVTELSAKADLKATIGAGCALGELGKVAGLVTAGTGKLTASVSAVADITTAIGG